MRTIVVAAVGRNGVIGVEGRLPWRIPEDMDRFKSMTMGHALVMGRSTFDSIGRPLPGRTTVVLTRRQDWSREGVVVAHSLEEGLEVVGGLSVDAYIAGGAEVYREAMDVADRLELTEVDLEPEGDTWFPKIEPGMWSETARDDREGFSFVTYTRAR